MATQVTYARRGRYDSSIDLNGSDSQGSSKDVISEMPKSLALLPLLSNITGCSSVLQTFWRMVVFPALARPRTRTRKHLNLLRSFLLTLLVSLEWPCTVVAISRCNTSQVRVEMKFWQVDLQTYIDVTGQDNMRVQKSRISREGKCDRRWQTSVEQTCTSWQVDCNMSK